MKQLHLLMSGAMVAILAFGAAPAHAAGVSNAPLTGASVNDTVYAVAEHGGTIYAGGDFGYAFEAGRRQVRTHLAATTTEGALTSFAPQVNGSVTALATDSRHLYVGGTFSEIDGVAMSRIARFNLTSGKLDTGFKVRINALPRSLAVGGGRLYIGGDFNTVNGQPRTKIAAVNVTDGSLVTGFAPQLDYGVRTLELAHDRLYIGGGFTEVNGSLRPYLAAVRPVDGTLVTGFVPAIDSVVWDVAVDGDHVYAAQSGWGGVVQSFDLAGNETWRRVTDGGTQALTVHEGVVYVGGHFETACGTTLARDFGDCRSRDRVERRKFFAVTSANTLLDWNPHSDSVRGVLAMTEGGGAVIAGGSFLTFGAGTQKQRGLAIFGA